MRYVDHYEVELSLPDDWGKKFREAYEYVRRKVQELQEHAQNQGWRPEEIQKAVKDARKKAIKARATLWVAAGQSIRTVMWDKCWYCETEEIRSDMPVDHFRPKSRVAECNAHGGYWWLCFNWENFRYSCTYCNSRRVDVESEGGKQDHFPILNPDQRALDENCNINLEYPVLLDPCDPDDVKLLIFHPNGRPREITQDKNSIAYIRASKSIELCHLDHYKAVRRRKQLAITIRQHVTEIDRLQRALEEGHDDNGQIKYHKKEIIKLIRSKAPFCTAVRLFFQQYRTREWVQEILDRDL